MTTSPDLTNDGTYDDGRLRIDPRGVTIRPPVARKARRTAHAKCLAYDRIRAARLISLGVGSGQLRLVGVSPLRPRVWFHWDPHRRSKKAGIELDVGRWMRLGITPDDPVRALELITDYLRKERSNP